MISVNLLVRVITKWQISNKNKKKFRLKWMLSIQNFHAIVLDMTCRRDRDATSQMFYSSKFTICLRVGQLKDQNR